MEKHWTMCSRCSAKPCTRPHQVIGTATYLTSSYTALGTAMYANSHENMDVFNSMKFASRHIKPQCLHTCMSDCITEILRNITYCLAIFTAFSISARRGIVCSKRGDRTVAFWMSPEAIMPTDNLQFGPNLRENI